MSINYVIGCKIDILRNPIIIDYLENIQQLISNEINWELNLNPYLEIFKIDKIEKFNMYKVNGKEINKHYLYKKLLPTNLNFKVLNIFINNNEIGCQIKFKSKKTIEKLNYLRNNYSTINKNNFYYISIGNINKIIDLQYFKFNIVKNIQNFIDKNNTIYKFNNLELIKNTTF